ncbi:MAG TPA: acetyl-CoA C-acyltransferase [Steroidobacteraceae bacterium]|jgi:acetyl-CoA C-acetyltransferase|nr:acetyl-CoA C-acyltransferase [Steroidobacteraceae bacterium]
MASDPVVILSARRTPIGAMLGAFASVPGHALGAAAMRGALENSGLDPARLGEVVMGCVLPAGQGQAPARQAAIGAGVPKSVPSTTVNKMCGSGMRAVMYGADHIAAGSADFVLAGGLESMTNAPYLLPKARAGYRMGHGEILDHMFYDGLQSPWDGKLMGVFADATAARYGFTRAEQDAFAAESVRRAVAAVESGAFAEEIAGVTIKDRKGERTVDRDETPFTVSVDKIPALKPAFGKDGTVTAASSSSISDGAAALVLARLSAASKAGLKPVARIVAHASHAQEPEWFTIAPVGAIRTALERAGWKAADVDLFEVNEAFAVVTMAAMKDIGIPHEKVNVNGGACALGHPIGATGARILTTLVHALRQRGGKRGLAALCIGGGEATAVAIELT